MRPSSSSVERSVRFSRRCHAGTGCTRITRSPGSSRLPASTNQARCASLMSPPSPVSIPQIHQPWGRRTENQLASCTVCHRPMGRWLANSRRKASSPSYQSWLPGMAKRVLVRSSGSEMEYGPAVWSW